MARCAPFEDRPQIAVACSGGGDSLALLALTAEWCRARGGQAVALVCDHAIRPESDEESRSLCTRLSQQFGLPVYLLRPRVSLREVQGNLQQAMRRFRLSACEHWCNTHAILHLALGHSQDDQAETLLLRLARGSGLSGLTAMRERRVARHIRLLRPLLAISRADLRSWLQSREITWHEDSSNALPIFARNRIRSQLALLQPEGLDSARLSAACLHLQRAEEALRAHEELFLACNTTLFAEGYVAIDSLAFLALPDEHAFGILSRLARLCGGTVVRWRQLLRQMVRLRKGLSDEPAFVFSLGRSLLHRPNMRKGRDNAFFLSRAAFALGDLALDVWPPETSWDGRFLVLAPSRPCRDVDVRLGALGLRGLVQLRATRAAAFARASCLLSALAHLPARVRPVVPSFWSGGAVCALPTLDFFARGFAPSRLPQLLWSAYAQEKSPFLPCESSISTPYYARESHSHSGGNAFSYEKPSWT